MLTFKMSTAFRTVTFLLICFMKSCSVGGAPLAHPINLQIVHEDIWRLFEVREAQLKKDDRPDTEAIDYGNGLVFFVTFDPTNDVFDATQSLLILEGTITIESRNKHPGEKGYDKRSLKKIFFRAKDIFLTRPTVKDYYGDIRGWDYLITAYDPPSDTNLRNKKPAIQYLTAEQLKTELKSKIDAIKNQKKITASINLETFVYTERQSKLKVKYDSIAAVMSFFGNFEALLLKKINGKVAINSKKPLNPLRVSLNLNFLISPYVSSDPNFYGIKVLPYDESSTEYDKDTLKVQRKAWEKDITDARPNHIYYKLGVVGRIAYEDGRTVDVAYEDRDGQRFTQVEGSFETKNRDRFEYLFQYDPKDVTVTNDWNSGSSPLKSTFFTCDNDRNAQIVLMEDEDTIGVRKRALDPPEHYRIGPYLQYIKDKKFERIVRIAVEIIEQKSCQEGYTRRRYRLMKNVVLTYDCNEKVSSFNTLKVMMEPENSAEAFTLEKRKGIKYDSEKKEFLWGAEKMSSFKLRQVYKSLPGNVPPDIVITEEFPSTVEQSKTQKAAPPTRNYYTPILLQSIMWELKILFQRITPRKPHIGKKGGVVMVDEEVLFSATLLKKDEVGKAGKVLEVTYKRTGNCGARKCVVDNSIRFDGTNVYDIHGNKEDSLILFFPEKEVLTKATSRLSLKHTERFLKQETFREDMKTLLVDLKKHCDNLAELGFKEKKLSLFIYYNDMNTAVGYYDCGFEYIAFHTDFKVIKFCENAAFSKEHDGLWEKSLSPEEDKQKKELRFSDRDRDVEFTSTESMVGNSDDILRKQYPNLIAKDLMIHEDTLNSRNMFMSNVFALRPLLGKSWSELKKGKRKLIPIGKQRAMIEVYAQNELYHNWLKYIDEIPKNRK